MVEISGKVRHLVSRQAFGDLSLGWIFLWRPIKDYYYQAEIPTHPAPWPDQQIRAKKYFNPNSGLDLRNAESSLGSFTNYIDKILAFFDHLPLSVDIFYGINVDKSGHF